MKTSIKSRIAFLIWRLTSALTLIILALFLLIDAMFIYFLFSADPDLILGSVIILLILALPEILIVKTLYLLFKNNFEKPDILFLEQKEFPEYYNRIHSICSYLKCPKVDRIGIDFGVDASFGYRRRIIFKKSILILGVPILLLLNERELDAVVAHECGHHSKGNRTGSKLITSLYNIDKKIEKIKNKTHNHFNKRILKWFYIQLHDFYFVISRSMELKSDQFTKKIASPQTLIDALIKMDAYRVFLENIFWDEISKLNCSTDEIPTNIFSLMESHLQKGWNINDELFSKYLSSIDKVHSFPFSTHPTIYERSMALGAEIPKIDGRFCADLLQTFQDRYQNALRAIFKDKADQILNTAGVKWSQNNKALWQKYFQENSEAQSRMTALEKLEHPTYDEKVELALLTDKIYGHEKSLEVFYEAEKLSEENRLARYHIGRLLTIKGDEQGAKILTDIMEEDSHYLDYCCYHLVNYYLVAGDRPKAAEFYWTAVNFMKTNSEVQYERQIKLHYIESFIKCDLSYKTLNEIRKELDQYKNIGKAYVVCRKADISGHFPLYIIGIQTKRKLSQKKSKAFLNMVMESLNKVEILPWEFILSPLNRHNIDIEFEMSKIEGSRII